jgi:hypothetical protein
MIPDVKIVSRKRKPFGHGHMKLETTLSSITLTQYVTIVIQAIQILFQGRTAEEKRMMSANVYMIPRLYSMISKVLHLYPHQPKQVTTHDSLHTKSIHIYCLELLIIHDRTTMYLFLPPSQPLSPTPTLLTSPSSRSNSDYPHKSPQSNCHLSLETLSATPPHSDHVRLSCPLLHTTA